MFTGKQSIAFCQKKKITLKIGRSKTLFIYFELTLQAENVVKKIIIKWLAKGPTNYKIRRDIETVILNSVLCPVTCIVY